MSNRSSSQYQIRRLGVIICAIRLVIALIATAAVMTFVWLAFGLIDALIAFEPEARLVITKTLLVVVALTLASGLVFAFRLSRTSIARLADRALRDPRHPAAVALSLTAQTGQTSLAKMLADRALEETAMAISKLHWPQLITWRKIHMASIGLVIPLLFIAGFRVGSPDAFTVVAKRLLHPGADIPPYSPLKFAIDPVKLSTVYGGTFWSRPRSPVGN